jgi:outer membrane protein assembly factor BamD (BamD/ComL family)
MGTKLYETGILYMKMEEYESAKMSFERVIDIYYDTDVVHLARQGMVKALAHNRQIDEAIVFLNVNKSKLTENGLFEEAEEAIHNIQKKIEKETE